VLTEKARHMNINEAEGKKERGKQRSVGNKSVVLECPAGMN